MREHYISEKVSSLFTRGGAEAVTPRKESKESRITAIMEYIDEEIHLANIDMRHHILKKLQSCLKEKL